MKIRTEWEKLDEMLRAGIICTQDIADMLVPAGTTITYCDDDTVTYSEAMPMLQAVIQEEGSVTPGSLWEVTESFLLNSRGSTNLQGLIAWMKKNTPFDNGDIIMVVNEADRIWTTDSVDRLLTKHGIVYANPGWTKFCTKA